MLKTITLVLLIGVLAWAFQATRPPPPSICGSQNGPPLVSPRAKLRDGRYLAYKESGVPKDTAKYKVIFFHGIGSGKLDSSSILTPEIAKELGVYLVTFDRPGYGESDPHPKRNLNTTALDVAELADHLGLGPKFYLIGFSMGGNAVWGCLKYIPHRLAGVSLLAPVPNYWWPGFPAQLCIEAYNEQYPQDQWAVRIAHYAPWLTYWWNTQNWFSASSVLSGMPKWSKQDMELIIAMKRASKENFPKENVTQQGEYESVHRDMMVGFGSWEFDPMDLETPFPAKEGSVHLWQGDEDGLVPVTLQRYIASRLPWIQYHEVPGGGHLFLYANGVREAIFRSLFLGEK